MYESIAPDSPASPPVPHLRVIRSEDRPSYDAGDPAPSPKRDAFLMMSWELYDQLKGDASAQVVLLALLRHADQDGECWPAIATLCEKTGKSDKHVRETINRLVEKGILTKTPRPVDGMRGRNTYRIIRKPAEEQFGTQDRAFGTQDRPVRYPVPHSSVPSTDELEPIELEPIEPDTPSTPPRGNVYSDEFEAFWLIYPKGHGSKKASFAHWRRMSQDDREEAVAAIPRFQAGRQWKSGYIKDCERWLRDRLWENPPEPESKPPADRSNGHAYPTNKFGERIYSPAELLRMSRGENVDDDPGNDGDVVDVGFRVAARPDRPSEDRDLSRGLAARGGG